MSRDSPGRRPRADSLRNRDRLLTAARKAFLSLGDEASLEAIARDAGVGIGTLYRHFPSRESLVAAVYEGELETVTAPGLVDEMVAREGSAAQALRSWMNQYAAFVATKHGMSDALRAGMASGDVQAGRTRQLVNGIVGGFLAAGAADGSLRADLAADVVTTALVGVLWSLGRTDPDQQPEQVRQLLDLIVSGLRTAPPH
ncbi:TetR family transcriptional regulator [Microlunatus endophyticus]|uniref:TetR family transcriptional regulator n=1 Tax=Microlunatus endophyticus TaxID=1716077 RepID=A0A917SEI3_9ACTN|nr:TetR family transcriptional regulator [Microlunatus endophyticus]